MSVCKGELQVCGGKGESNGLEAHTELPCYLGTDTSTLQTLFVNTYKPNTTS